MSGAQARLKKPMPLKDYLKKQGPHALSAWHKRYFLQTEESLHYFKSHRDLAQGPKGFIELTRVIGVTVEDEGKGIFELATVDRNWRLQLCDDSDLTLQQWVTGIREWVQYFKLRLERQRKLEQELEKQGISTPIISTDFTLDPMPLSAATATLPTAATAGSLTFNSSLALDAFTIAEIGRLRSASDLLVSEVAEHESEIQGLQSRIELLQSELDTQEHYKSHLIDQKREGLKLALIDTDRAVDDAKTRLRQLDTELQESELDCSDLNSQVLELEEQLQVQKAVAQADAEDALDIAKQYDAQQTNIAAYRAQIDHNVLEQAKQTLGSQYESLEHLWLSSAQQQSDNEMLMKKIQKMDAQSKAEIKAKTQLLEIIKKELDATEGACRKLEDHILAQEGVDRQLFDQLKDLKEKLFISLAVGIKLWGEVTRTFKTREVDLGKLYKAAALTQPDWKTWKYWIQSVLVDTATLQPGAKLPVGPPTADSGLSSTPPDL